MLLRALGGLSIISLVAGCTAVVRSQPAEVVYTEDVVVVDRAPPNIQTYPREYYGGVEVYLVDGRWYRNYNGRWQVYRTEPVELGRRRVIYERRAVPPRRDRYDRYDRYDRRR